MAAAKGDHTMVKKISWSAVILVALLSVGCSRPGTSNYPYDMFDSDVDTLIQLMKSGGDGLLEANDIIRDNETLARLWGKTKNATIVKRVHVLMNGYYWVDVETTAGKKEQIIINYSPNLGRVEVSIKDVAPLR